MKGAEGMIEEVYIDKAVSYSPFNERSNSLGMVTEWVARNGYGNAVCVEDTKKECIASAKRRGYKIVKSIDGREER